MKRVRAGRPIDAVIAGHCITRCAPYRILQRDSNCITDLYNRNLTWWTQRDSNPHKLVERGHYPRLSCALENAPGARPLFRSLLLHPQPYGTRHLLCMFSDLLARCTARPSHNFYHQPDYSAPRLTIVLRCGISSPMSPNLDVTATTKLTHTRTVPGFTAPRALAVIIGHL